LKLISLFNSHALYFLALSIVHLCNFICCCWFCRLVFFCLAAGKQGTATVAVPLLSENIPTKAKTPSECLDDELDLDLELDIGNVVSINTLCIWWQIPKPQFFVVLLYLRWNCLMAIMWREVYFVYNDSSM